MDDGLFIKVIVVGASGVGKTSILNQYCYGKFDQTVAPTISCDFSLKVLNDVNGRSIRLQLWDVAGQERFQSVSKLYIRGALGCIIVCDVTSEDSLNTALGWKEFIETSCDLIQGEIIPIILLQNKSDLLQGVGKIEPYQTNEFLKEFALKNKFIDAFQVSAKSDLNLKESIDCLLQQILKKNIYSASALDSNGNFGDNNQRRLTDGLKLTKESLTPKKSNKVEKNCC